MTTPDPIPARLAALKTATTQELKAQWRDLFDREPPPLNRRHLENRFPALSSSMKASLD